MAPYTSNQRAMITQFMNLTQAKDSIAAKHLKNQDWNIERALDVFYGNMSSDTPLAVALGKIFDKYRTANDTMEIGQTMVYLNEIGVDVEEPACYAVSDLLSSPSLGEINRDGFTTGWTEATKENNRPLDTIAKQSAYMATQRKNLKTDHALFKKIYRAAFVYGKAEGTRSVNVDDAEAFWRMFFTAKAGIDWRTPTATTIPWLDLWIEYYTTTVNRPVNKDLWNMAGELMLKTIAADGEKLSWYSPDGAWPMHIDNFITWVKEQRPELQATEEPPADDVEMTNS